MPRKTQPAPSAPEPRRISEEQRKQLEHHVREAEAANQQLTAAQHAFEAAQRESNEKVGAVKSLLRYLSAEYQFDLTRMTVNFQSGEILELQQPQ